MIGDKNYWGMGIGSFVIHLIIDKKLSMNINYPNFQLVGASKNLFA